MTALVNTVVHDRYRLDVELGRGGMGTVYRAHDAVLKREVAVKLLTGTGLGTEGKARMLREAQAAASLNHPNLIAVYDAGEADLGKDGQTPFVVMELVDGQNLHEQPPQDLAQTLEITRQLCAALDHAHSRGIIHRDLKPENVMLTAEGASKLADFGLARSVSSRLTTEGTIAGTLDYLAPELALGQDFDRRVDLYSLGVMLYELTTGQLPFAADDPVSVITQHLYAPVVPPRAHNEEIPPPLNALIVQLMAKDPEERPAAAVLEALDALDLEEETIESVDELSLLERIVRGRLVGRERELAEARTLWNKASSGNGQTLLISGEPGIGKTRLTRELATQVEVTGGRALVGECYEGGGAPYAPFAQIVRHGLQDGQGKTALQASDLPPFVLPDLLTLAPELRSSYPDVPPNPPLEPESEQRRMFENVVTFCRLISDRNPLLVVLEDAHWADSGSLALMRHLSRRLRSQPAMIVATYREVELDETLPFNRMLIDLNRERIAERIKLSRFSREETEAMLAALFAEEITPAFLEGIYRETEGNPFFVEEVCKSLIESGQLYHQDGAWHRPQNMSDMVIPQSIRVAIQSRIARFPKPYQETLNLAAILGREFDFDTLLEASEQDEDTLLDALEAAEDAQIIEEVGRKGAVTFSFVHALIPNTLVEGVRTLRRRRLHQRAALAIEVLHPEAFEDLAHHYEQSGDEERACTYYSQAGRRAAAAFANQEAESHFRAALDLELSEADRADLTYDLAEVVSRLGRLEEAIAIWQDAAEHYAALGNTERVAWCYTKMARARWHAGDMESALAICEAGLDQTASAPESGALAGLIHETARAHQFLGSSDQALAMCRKALEMARSASDAQVEADALVTMGMNPNLSIEEAIVVYEEAIEICQKEKLLAVEGRAHNNLAVRLSWDEADISNSHEHQLRSAEISRAMGDLSGELFSFTNILGDLVFLGRLDEAEQMLPHGQELYDQLADPGEGGRNFLGAVNQYAFTRGRFEQAEEGGRSLLKQALESGSDYGRVFNGNWMGIILIELNKIDEAIRVLNEALQAADRANWIPVLPRAFMVAALARKKDVEGAKKRLLEAEQILAKQPQKMAEMFLHNSRANLLAAASEWQQAFEVFEKAVSEYAARGLRPNQAKNLRDWAEAHLQRDEPGDADRARKLLGEALGIYQEMGADGWVERVQARINEIND